MIPIIKINNCEVTFAEYLASHPHLYDGIDLTGNEIETINRHFWEYTLKEKTFSHHYLEKLSFYLKQYHEMKAIEFIDKIKEITTRKEILKIAGHIASNETRDRDNWGTTTNNIGRRVTNDDNRNANRTLPMKSTGDDFDDTVNWEKGASNIAETKNEVITDAATDVITRHDTDELQALSNQWNTNDHDREVIGDQAVNLIKNIWNYLAEPKAMEWLCNKLEPCFILCW